MPADALFIEVGSMDPQQPPSVRSTEPLHISIEGYEVAHPGLTYFSSLDISLRPTIHLSRFHIAIAGVGQ